MVHPGWGLRHPALLAVLAATAPVAVAESSWHDGRMPVRISAYVGAVDLPGELVTSVRCLVQVGGNVVVCTNRDGISHPWPGGRRRPDETLLATAVREVHEETGWLVEPGSLRQLGWLHLEHLAPLPRDHPYPHPDFCQVVLSGRASERDGGLAVNWTDRDGYEISSQLMTINDAIQAVSGDPASRPYLLLLAA
jgi:ADP-ribose pyrophosphatase YjhB (NUDIX family)